MSTEREEKNKLSKELTDKYEELNKFTTKKGRLKINKKNKIKKIITDKKDKIKFEKYLDLAEKNKKTPEKQNIKITMSLIEQYCKKHQITLEEFRVLKNESNNDYHNSPIPVLMQPTIDQGLINEMEEYNIKNGTNYGFNITSILV